MSESPLTILCLASYEKGGEFLRECKRQGCRVLLLTSQSVGRAPWPHESLDEIFLMPDVEKRWDMKDLVMSVSYLARQENIDLIVPLDDFDLEKAATLREHLRLGGMGESATRYFRDKLAMRMRAREAGIAVPEFVHSLNHAKLQDYLARVPSPWLLKPRFEASATGIKKINSPAQFWDKLNKLGDRQSFHLLERYVPGDIYHVDAIVSRGLVLFAEAHRYGSPPMDIAHGGGIFVTGTVRRGTEEESELLALNRQVIEAMGLESGVSHTEFIKGRDDGRFYFLETAARVGGANIVELIEAATGVNLWREWAKVEIDCGRGQYQVHERRSDYGGLIVSLARQEYPDTSRYHDPEIVWRLKKRFHVGLIVKSSDPERVQFLMEEYSRRFYEDFYATQPLPERSIS